jgi:hypothetical protein
MVKTTVYAECPSPKTKEEYEAVVQSMFAAVLAEECSPAWKTYSFSDSGEGGFKVILFLL